MELPFSATLPTESITTTPPVLPFQYGDVTVPPSVALRYCGTRMICQVWRPRFVARLPCS